MKSLLIILTLVLSGGTHFDKTVHDFGTIGLKDGPQTCTFTLSNDKDNGEDVMIYAVITTCGCTDAEWTLKPVKPGEKGYVKVSFTNDEGPYPFDKTLSVYTSIQEKPFILHIKGNVKKNAAKSK